MDFSKNISDKEFLIFLGKRITEIRLKKKISQTEIAYRCGFDKSNYNTIENGKRNPTILSLQKIAQALEVELIEFFFNNPLYFGTCHLIFKYLPCESVLAQIVMKSLLK